MAGLTMDREPVPSEEDMIKAKTKDVLVKLKEVDMEVLPKFTETAELLIK